MTIEMKRSCGSGGSRGKWGNRETNHHHHHQLAIGYCQLPGHAQLCNLARQRSMWNGLVDRLHFRPQKPHQIRKVIYATDVNCYKNLINFVYTICVDHVLLPPFSKTQSNDHNSKIADRHPHLHIYTHTYNSSDNCCCYIYTFYIHIHKSEAYF